MARQQIASQTSARLRAPHAKEASFDNGLLAAIAFAQPTLIGVSDPDELDDDETAKTVSDHESTLA